MDASRSSPPPFGAGLSALIVDDEPSMREFLSRVFTQLGFRTTVAEDLTTATGLVACQGFDVYLVDKNLPDGNGMTLAARLIKSDAAIILMSGYANLHSAIEAVQLGLADYLLKPFPLNDLIPRLQRCVATLLLRRENANLVDQLRVKNEELAGLVVRDPLTRLYNHAFCHEAVDRELERCRRYDISAALALIDIDSFQAINDRLGRATGDVVLCALAEVLTGHGFNLRGSDIAARVGGDQFVLLFPETDKVEACAIVQRLRRAVAAARGAAEPAWSVSIGVAAFPEDASSRDELFAHAAAALRYAKAGGRDRVAEFTADLPVRDDTLERTRMRALEVAITERDFRHVYQPIVSARDGGLFAYESLVRCAQPTLANPVELFALAARAGRIPVLGRLLREMCVRPMAELAEPTLLFINLHPWELHDSNLAAGEAFLLPWAHRIVFEVTEAAEISNYKRTQAVIARLHDQGYRVALDDVGAGYAGLNSLALLGPDFVKIDMAMIRGLRAGTRSARLIRHVLDFASGEGMPVIAEGIETADERDVVVDLGVPYLQGYLFGRPQPPFAAPLPVPAR